jgi:hypothetical protein
MPVGSNASTSFTVPARHEIVLDGKTSRSLDQRRNQMKKITVRKAGTVRLTSAAASCYCHGTGPRLVLV